MKTSKQINSEIAARLKAVGFQQDSHGLQSYSNFDARLLTIKFATVKGVTTFECSDTGLKATFNSIDDCFAFFDNFGPKDSYDDDMHYTCCGAPEAAQAVALPVSMVEIDGEKYPLIDAEEHEKQQGAIDAMRRGVDDLNALKAAGYELAINGEFSKELPHAECIIFEMAGAAERWDWMVNKLPLNSHNGAYAEGEAKTVEEAIRKAAEAALEIDSEYEMGKLIYDKLSLFIVVLLALGYALFCYSFYKYEEYGFALLAIFMTFIMFASGYTFAMGYAGSYLIRTHLGLPVDHLIGHSEDIKEGK